MKFIVALMILGLAIPCWAGEKEELILKQQVLQERVMRIQMQIQLLQDQLEKDKKEFAEIAEKMKKLDEPKKEEPKKK